MRYVVRKGGLDLLLDLGVDEVALGYGEHPVLDEQFGIVFLEFLEEGTVSCGDVVLLGGDHEQEYGVALDVAQEADAYAAAFVSAFDDARDVGHYERAVVVVLDNSQVGLQCGEGIVGNLRFG